MEDIFKSKLIPITMNNYRKKQVFIKKKKKIVAGIKKNYS